MVDVWLYSSTDTASLEKEKENSVPLIFYVEMIELLRKSAFKIFDLPWLEHCTQYTNLNISDKKHFKVV